MTGASSLGNWMTTNLSQSGIIGKDYFVLKKNNINNWRYTAVRNSYIRITVALRQTNWSVITKRQLTRCLVDKNLLHLYINNILSTFSHSTPTMMEDWRVPQSIKTAMCIICFSSTYGEDTIVAYFLFSLCFCQTRTYAQNYGCLLWRIETQSPLVCFENCIQTFEIATTFRLGY